MEIPALFIRAISEIRGCIPLVLSRRAGPFTPFVGYFIVSSILLPDRRSSGRGSSAVGVRCQMLNVDSAEKPRPAKKV
jgi:hypothetical protein